VLPEYKAAEFQKVYVYSLTILFISIFNRSDLVRETMAFALHVNMEKCTGCNNCVVACPVDALELYTEGPVAKDKIYKVVNGKAVILDFNSELCAGCGVCVEACPYGVIRLAGPWESRARARKVEA